MAQADDRPERRWSGSWADTLIALIIGPLLVWGADLLQAVWADVPLDGFTGSSDAVLGGLFSAIGVYLVAFALVRGLLELPRWVVQELRGAPCCLPRVLVGALTVLLLLVLDL
ncbi:MAG: hypothetical protein GX774_19570 [Armatimonadetes bacterium]|jgi:hypothetical protein|nr:hypothetical protein [Armatimonadota bacterium]